MTRFCILGVDCEQFDRTNGFGGYCSGFNLCEPCCAHSIGDVAALVYDYVDLSQLIGRRSGNSDVKIARPKPASVPPIDLTVHTLRSAMAVRLVGCEVALRLAAGTPVRFNAHVREGFDVQQAVSYVAPRVDTLAGLPPMPEVFDPEDDDVTGADALMGLRGLHEMARRVCGLTELTIALPGECPSCKALGAQSRRNGADTVTCGNCRHVQPWEDYQRHVSLAVSRNYAALPETEP